MRHYSLPRNPLLDELFVPTASESSPSTRTPTQTQTRQTSQLESSDVVWKMAVGTFNRMAHTPTTSGPSSAAALWKGRSEGFFRRAHPPANTYAGRSVEVKNGDVATAYNKLQGILVRNNVRKELRLTERHEKKSDKRRRLESERHRKRFADFIRKKVQLVKAIRARGA